VFEDFNGDNKRDLFLGNESGGLVYFENNDVSNGSFIISSDKIEFEFFPNPNQGLLYIKTNKDTEIEIFSLIGQKVYEKKVTNSRSIDISLLAKGTYFLRIIQNKDARTEKIIIQ
jgi:hypothetical protein